MKPANQKHNSILLKIIGTVMAVFFVGFFSAYQANAAGGELWAWGYNGWATLGLGDHVNRSSPTQSFPPQSGPNRGPVSVDATSWISVDAGMLSSYAIKSSSAIKVNEGSLWVWGTNKYSTGGIDYGPLGLGYSSADITSPTKVGSATWTSVATLASAPGSTVAIKADGTLWAWGFNPGGQLGLGYATTNVDTPTRVGSATNWRSVVAGYYHFMGIKTDGTLWAWGGNDGYGALGLGPVNQGQPASYYYSPHQVGSDSNWASVQAGYHGTAALKTNGTLWAWGADNFGQLGLGYTSDRTWPTPNLYIGTPTQVGTDSNWASISTRSSEHVMGIKTDGTLWAWGTNVYGELGLGTGGTYYGPSSPTRVGSDTNWASVSGGNFPYNYTMAIKADGTLWAWGNNQYGQLGLGDTTDRHSPTQVGTSVNWASVSAGSYYTLARKTTWIVGSPSSGSPTSKDVTDYMDNSQNITVPYGDNPIITWSSPSNAYQCHFQWNGTDFAGSPGWPASGSFRPGIVTGYVKISGYCDDTVGRYDGWHYVTFTALPNPSTLKACVNSCTTGASAITSLAMGQNDTRTIVACYNTATACDAPDNTGNVTLSSVWTESGTDVVSLSNQSNSTKKFQSGTAYGTEAITITYLTQSVALNVTVPCIETMTCDSKQNDICSGKTVPAGTTLAGICGTVDCSGKTGKRYCDFNWKEVAP